MMDTLETQLQGYGLGNIPLVGPDTAQTSTAVNSYIPAMLADPMLMPHVLQFGFHTYGGSTASDSAVTNNSTYPGRQIISDEYDGNYFDEYDGQVATPSQLWTQADTSFQNLIGILGAGENGALLWDGVDNYYQYYGEWSAQGIISYNWNAPNPTAQSDYAATPRLYADAQVFQFVPQGAVLVGSTTTATNFLELAFRDPDGRITVVGENTGASNQNITGSLAGGPGTSQFNMYFTNASLDEQQQSNVNINSNSFSFSVPADTIFTLITVPTVPSITALSPRIGLTTGGQTVTISGSDFTNATKVSFGGVPAGSFTVNSDQQITAITPAGTVGTFDVAVTIPSGSSATSVADQFQYIAPNGSAPPTLASAISATLNGNQSFALLNVGASSQYGPGNLTYSWTTLGTPPAPVTFTANNHTSASNLTAIFYDTGNYNLQVTITDPAGNSVTSNLALTVNQVATTFSIVPNAAAIAPNGVTRFTDTVLDQFENSDLIAPNLWSVSGGGTIDNTGKFTAGSSAGGLFTVTASLGGLTASSPISILSGVNIAPSGTAYRWSGLNNATSNSNAIAAPGLNDNNLATDVPLTGGGDDAANAYEAAGILWSSTQSIFDVTFTNGSFGGSNNGVFDNNVGLQITTNGTTWTAASGWTLTPAYPYNLASAAETTYTFTGPAVAVMGVRVVGEVHSLTGTDSLSDNATEVQAFNSYIPLPKVTGLGTASGSALGGATVTISGSNFTGAATVSFGGLPAAAFTVNSATQITAIAPPSPAAGPADVQVTTADGISATSTADQFTYLSAIAGEYLFYKDSVFDTLSDDAAIAPDKTALLPGQIASFANYSSYVDGINGIMVDIVGTGSTLVPVDFQISVGNDNNPAAWPAGPAPTVTTRPGAGAAGSTRIELTWPDGTLTDEWVQITVLADADTGLAANAVFYFGNAIGESGNSSSDAQVTLADELGAQDNPANLLMNPAPITDPYDFNRDGRVDAADQIIARANTTNSATALQLINPPSGGGSPGISHNSIAGPATAAITALAIAPAEGAAPNSDSRSVASLEANQKIKLSAHFAPNRGAPGNNLVEATGFPSVTASSATPSLSATGSIVSPTDAALPTHVNLNDTTHGPTWLPISSWTLNPHNSGNAAAADLTDPLGWPPLTEFATRTIVQTSIGNRNHNR